MALAPYTERQKTLIVNNVVRACEDIETLNRTGYRFINLAQGFIAHYNLYGFRDAYSEPGLLRSDILENQIANKWRNFRPGDENYEYYSCRADIYNRIVEKISEN